MQPVNSCKFINVNYCQDTAKVTGFLSLQFLKLIAFLPLFVLFILGDTTAANAQVCGSVCSGFRTQTQGGWGATPNGGNPGVYLHANFAAAFPTGLTIGCVGRSVKLTTAQAITDILPAGSGPALLPSGNAINPSSLNTVLAGQLITAKLNVGFDSYDPSFGINASSLGGLIYNSGIFVNKTVQFVIDEADKAIGDCGSIYGLSDLNNALDQLNNNYDDGTSGSGNGHFNCPSSVVPTVADITGPLTVCIGATINLLNVTPSGVWSSNNATNATISNTGLVSGIAIGTATISYMVTTACGSATKTAIITIDNSCGGVPGGGGGGLESKSLGDAVGNRIFNNAVNSAQGPIDYTKLPSVQTIGNRNVIAGVGTSITLSEILPRQITGTSYKVFNSTPNDIPSITNANDVLSLDFTLNSKAKAVAFGTKTLGEVYDHTKAICDRLKGSELMNIENVTVNNIKLVRYDLKNTSGQMEYAFSFVIGAKAGRSNYTLQSNWLNKDYTADEVMYNIQLWAETPSLIVSMASDIINRLSGSMQVKEVLSNGTVPKTYITKGKRESNNVVLSLTNTTAGTNGYFEIKVKDNEQSTAVTTKQIPFTISTNGKASVNVPVSDTYEATVNMYLNNVLTDQVFMADGNWAVNSNNATNSIKSFKVSNDAKRVNASTDEFPLFRNVSVEANVTDNIAVYKLLRGGGATQDLTGYKSFIFNAKGTGVIMNIILVKEGISNWSEQYALQVPLTSNNQEYKISLDDFKASNSKNKINPNDITTVIFSLINPSGRMNSVTTDIANAAFSKIDVGYLASLNSTEMNVYPNPSNGRFTASFKASKAMQLTLALRDAATGIPVFTKSVSAQVGDNTVPVAVEKKQGMNSYILTLEGENVKYNAKKILMDK